MSDRSQGQQRTDREVAEAALCSLSTVRSIRRRYIEGGLPLALNDKGWPGAVPKLTGEVEAKLTMLACSEPPKGHARWTLRLLANQMVELGYVDDVSHVTVREGFQETATYAAAVEGMSVMPSLAARRSRLRSSRSRARRSYSSPPRS